MNLNLRLNSVPKQVLWFQLLILLGLLVLSFISYLYRYFGFGQTQSFRLWLFYVDAEKSVVTWYSAFLLLLCAVLLAAIAFLKSKTHPRYVRQWQGLALIFTFLSIDETISMHEKLISPLRSVLNASGFFHFAWVVVAIPLVALFVIVYLPFLSHLPRKNRRIFWLSGITYIAGAIGFEMISGPIAASSGHEVLSYAISVHFEEGLEMLGLTIFVYGLLSYLSSYIEEVVVCLNPAENWVTAPLAANKGGNYPLTPKKSGSSL